MDEAQRDDENRGGLLAAMFAGLLAWNVVRILFNPPEPRRSISPPSLLWFGVLGAATAWLLHLLAAYAIAEFGCVAHFAQTRLAGVTGLSWLLIAVTVLLLIPAVLSVRAAALCRYRLRGMDPPVGREDVLTLERDLANIGVLMSALFVLVIIAQAVPIFFFLQAC